MLPSWAAASPCSSASVMAKRESGGSGVVRSQPHAAAAMARTATAATPASWVAVNVRPGLAAGADEGLLIGATYSVSHVADRYGRDRVASGRADEGGRTVLPEWWEWELELTPHVERRMEDRGFTEIDLRDMLEGASHLRPDVVVGRWVAETRHGGRPWEVIVEPDSEEHVLVVITAYPCGEERTT